MQMPSTRLHAIMLLFLLFAMPIYGEDTVDDEEENHTFYGLITPATATHWQVELQCDDNCKDFPPVLHADVTPRRLKEAGIFAFNLAPLPSKRHKYTPMRRLRVTIRSADALGGKIRTNVWWLEKPQLGTKLYHFQFGHFEPADSHQSSLFLRVQFTHALKPLDTKMKYMLVLKDRQNRRLMEDRELTAEEWGGQLKEMELKMEAKSVRNYLRLNRDPTMYLAVKKIPSDNCTICLSAKGKMKKLECGHCFHQACIDRWAAEKKQCPNCPAALKVKEKGGPPASVKKSGSGRFLSMFTPKAMESAYVVTEKHALLEESTVFHQYLQMPIIQNGRKPHYTYKLDSRRRNIGQAVLHSLRNAVDSRTNHSEVEVMEKPMAQTAADIAQALLAEEGQAQSNAAGGGEAAANGDSGDGTNYDDFLRRYEAEANQSNPAPENHEPTAAAATGNGSHSQPDGFVDQYAAEWDQDDDAHLRRLQEQLNREGADAAAGRVPRPAPGPAYGLPMPAHGTRSIPQHGPPVSMSDGENDEDLRTAIAASLHDNNGSHQWENHAHRGHNTGGNDIDHDFHQVAVDSLLTATLHEKILLDRTIAASRERAHQNQGGPAEIAMPQIHEYQYHHQPSQPSYSYEYADASPGYAHHAHDYDSTHDYDTNEYQSNTLMSPNDHRNPENPHYQPQDTWEIMQDFFRWSKGPEGGDHH